VTWQAPRSDPTSGPVSEYIVEAGSASGRNDLANVHEAAFSNGHISPAVPTGVYFVPRASVESFWDSPPSNEVQVVVP